MHWFMHRYITPQHSWRNTVRKTILNLAIVVAVSQLVIPQANAAAVVPRFNGGWVHDGKYAAQPLEGNNPETYKPILGIDTVPSIDWAISRGMRQLTLNVGVDYLVVDGNTGGVYSARYRAGSLEAMLKKVTDWNTAHEAQPDLLVGVKLRLHAGTRQTKAVKDTVGTIKVNDDTFGVGGTVPKHWIKIDGRYPFREMYQMQMKAVANGVATFNKNNGYAIQAIIVPGNAFLYPEPFTIMQNSRNSTPQKLDKALVLNGEKSVNSHLESLFGDGSGTLKNRSYTVKNIEGNPIQIRCGGKWESKPVRPGETYTCISDPTTNGADDRIYTTSATKYAIAGATNLQKMYGYGLRDDEQVSYYRWLVNSAHDAFVPLRNVHIGIALNPYKLIGKTNDIDAKTARCMPIETGNEWVRKWKGRAQIENYSYRSDLASPAANPSKPLVSYAAIYRAMEFWATKRGVITGVQLARTPQVWKGWPHEKEVWNALALDAADRGWSFVEPTGDAMDQNRLNAWPIAYKDDRDGDFVLSAIGLIQNQTADKTPDYETGVTCS